MVSIIQKMYKAIISSIDTCHILEVENRVTAFIDRYKLSEERIHRLCFKVNIRDREVIQREKVGYEF